MIQSSKLEMAIYSRKNLRRIDVLETENEELRTGFTEISKAIGRLKGTNSESAAHILHLRPLIVAGVIDEAETVFYPESPDTYERSAKCLLHSQDNQSGYSIFHCENIDNAALVLKAAYPKVVFADDPPVKTVALGYFNGQKAVDVENSLANSIQTLPNSPKIFSVKGKDGKDYPVDHFEEMYEKSVWPIAKMNFKRTRSHFFTYFRELEVKYNRAHAGTEGTRPRHLSTRIYFEYYRARAWNLICRTFGY